MLSNLSEISNLPKFISLIRLVDHDLTNIIIIEVAYKIHDDMLVNTTQFSLLQNLY